MPFIYHCIFQKFANGFNEFKFANLQIFLADKKEISNGEEKTQFDGNTQQRLLLVSRIRAEQTKRRNCWLRSRTKACQSRHDLSLRFSSYICSLQYCLLAFLVNVLIINLCILQIKIGIV